VVSMPTSAIACAAGVRVQGGGHGDSDGGPINCATTRRSNPVGGPVV